MEVRINKFLSEAGVCSRREADRQIEAGNVTIGGKTARMGDQVSDGQPAAGEDWRRCHAESGDA